MNEHTTGIVDNWCRDEVFAEEHCAKEKARLLINANCTKDSFFGYMPSGKSLKSFNFFSNTGLTIPFDKAASPIVYTERNEYGNTWQEDARMEITIEDWACFTGSFNNIPDQFDKSLCNLTETKPKSTLPTMVLMTEMDDIQLYTRLRPGTLYFKFFALDNAVVTPNGPVAEKDTKSRILGWLKNNWVRVFLHFYNKYPDELTLCGKSANAAATCRYFQNSGKPYDKFKEIRGITQEFFNENDDKIPDFPMKECNFPDLVESITAKDLDHYLNVIIDKPILRYYALPSAIEKRFGSTKMVYSFKNEYGQTMMKVIKCLSEKHQCICMVPITCWRYRSCYYHQLYALPWASGKQPLYNLDLLMKDRDEDKYVVITDSIEIADYMQEKCRYKNVVFTSFICQPGRYDQVDWSPLKPQITEDENRAPGQIYIACLVTNHTGKKLEQQYLEAQKLVRYLQENEELDIQNFLERPVSYTDDDTGVIEDIDDLLDKKHTGFAGQAKLLTTFQFNAMCNKAEALLQEKKLEFSSENFLGDSIETKNDVTKEKGKTAPPEFVFFPILMRGDWTALVGPQKSMKSFLALSIAMLATNAGGQRVKSLFHEMLWKASKPNNVGGSRGHKVLYLDFENGERTMLRRIARLKNHYWPQKNEDIEKCQSNLIIKYLDKRTKYPEPANLRKLYDMIEEANNQGDPDHDVDLLIIDSFEGFNGNDMNFSNVNDINNFIDDIRSKFKNMAILSINHLSTQAGKGKESASRGNSAAFNNIQNEVVIQIDEALKKITTKREETSEDEKDEAIYEGRQINITYRQNREGYVIDEIMKFVGILPKAKDEAYFQVAGLEREVNLNKEEKDKLYKNNLKKLKKWLCDDMDVDKDSFESMINMTENTLRDHMK